MSEQKSVAFKGEEDLKKLIATSYMKQIQNYFGDEKQALRFLSGVVAATQRTPKLLDCTPTSVINSFMVMAQLQLMPSGVSGEAYVIPYSNKKLINGKWESVMEAQFQLGYQGLVTLFYRAGVKAIVAEIVRQDDRFVYENGNVLHQPDVFADDRGPAIGGYVIVTLGTGGKITKVMSKKEIMEFAQRFSKSYSADKGKKTPWDEASDPQLWMWRKTILKQAAKLVPKNDAITSAIAEDNKDSNLLEAKPTFNLEDCQKKLESSATLEVLAANWSLLPAEAKLELGEVKDEMKKQLATQKAAIVKDLPITAEEVAEIEAEDAKKNIA